MIIQLNISNEKHIYKFRHVRVYNMTSTDDKVDRYVNLNLTK